ncbi:MAG: type II CRISPR RNA-guided endonuclease Cas9, partial [Rhodospirillales bacterium]|nr:type II CRISPR RNA-guided endonuclease Cas9 [Rhodospirillales bacterium]
MTYRLGVDMGTNSIGWCLLDLGADGAPCAVRDIGVRLFHDGRDAQSGASLAADRRGARSARRRRDRYLLRRRDFMAAPVLFGLMPTEKTARKSLEKLDPYEIRARGLDHRLELYELGRALFHLSQRRGFKSNRKTDPGGGDAGKIKRGGGRLAEAMKAEKARTLGEFLYRLHAGRKPVRARLSGVGAKAAYDYFPQRAMLEREFDILWRAQADFHAQLNDEAREALRRVIFRQRPLKPAIPGKCAMDPAVDSRDLGGLRAPWALPLAQEFRILHKLSNLRIEFPDQSTRPLNIQERDRIASQLSRKGTISFNVIRKIIGPVGDIGFNLEGDKRGRLLGDQTAHVLANKSRFGPGWRELSRRRQSEIVERLVDTEDEAELVGWLMDECRLGEETAMAVANAPLPQNHCRLGRRALIGVVAAMRESSTEDVCPATGEVLAIPISYAEAARRAGYHHSDRRPENLLGELPYYGEALAGHVSGSGDPDHGDEIRWGRIANPTVHIGLGQLRALVNAIIRDHGPPDGIVVELARELKLGKKEKDEINRKQVLNQKRNDERREKMSRIGQRDSGENRLRMRLWEELNPDDPLDRRCPYGGRQISLDMLYTDEVEIEHILPFSRTLDNSAANKTVSLRVFNRQKGNRSPHEAFGHDENGWSHVLERAQGLPKNKRWRFAADAMARFEGERSFLDRQLTDTAYLARITRRYLSYICPAERVGAIPGRLTAMLRGKWGLNSLLSDANLKNRFDHRHHAIDAAIAALTDQGMLQRIATAAEGSRARLIEKMPEPWEGFRDELRNALREMTVSHRLDHGIEGKLHEETAYGLVRNADAENGCNLVRRKPLVSLTDKEIEAIRDRDLRQKVRNFVFEGEAAGVKKEKALADFSEKENVRRVRILKKETDV